MNFRVLRGIRPILVSLSIVASSSQVESAKIDVNFIADVLDRFAEYKEGKFDAEKAFKEDFDYLNKEAFNGGLFFNCKNMSKFARYLEVHTLRKFFDCNEPIKRSFEFVHKNITGLKFLLYDFKQGDVIDDEIKRAVENNGLDMSKFTIRALNGKKISENKKGNSRYFEYLSALGLVCSGESEISCGSFCRWYNMKSCESSQLHGTSVYVFDLVKEEVRSHLGKDKFEELEKRVGSDELYGILSFMFVTLHEIAHNVDRYLGALERLCGVAKSDNPVNMRSGIEEDKSNRSLFFRAYWEKDIGKIGELLYKLEVKEKIDKIKAYREGLENNFGSELNLEELKNKANNRKAGYEYLGHTKGGVKHAEKVVEDIANSVALDMLPCCVNFAGPEALRECLNAYADKLLSFCK